MIDRRGYRAELLPNDCIRVDGPAGLVRLYAKRWSLEDDQHAYGLGYREAAAAARELLWREALPSNSQWRR